MKTSPAVAANAGAGLGPLDRLSGMAYRIYGKYATRVTRGTPWLKDEIIRSNMRITPEGLVALSFFGATLAAIVWISELAVAVVTVNPILLLAGSVLASTPALAFLLTMRSPRISQGSRSAALESELPFMIGFIVVLAGGGVSPIASIRRIAKMSDIFPASAKEAKRILLDIDVFGLDPISAFEKAARFNPNRLFAEFLYGYTTVIKTGGDLSSYLNNKLKEIYEARAQKVKRSSDTVATLAEGYVTITSVLGITLFTLFQSQSIVSSSSSGIQGLEVFGLIGVPALSFLFIYLLDNVQAKFPFVDYRPYKAFLYSVPIGVAFFFVPLPLTLFVHVSVSLILTVTYPTIVATRASNERKALESRLPDFIRDISEGRKIGLSPEATVQGLADKHYGLLSRHVKRMSSQLSWGVSLRQVISTFVSGVKSWLTREAGMLLMEVVDAGGGTVRSFTDMADFTRKVNDLESEKRSSLRPYIFIMYFSSIMVVVTTLIMVYFVSTPFNLSVAGRAAQPTKVDLGTTNILLTIAAVESWVIGIVAGKMGEGSTADGFKHALILVVIGLASVYIAQAVLGIRIQ